MPFTRCSRASSSTSRLAVLLVTRGRCVFGRGGGVFGGGRAVRGGGRAVHGGGGGVLGRSRADLGGGRGALGGHARGSRGVLGSRARGGRAVLGRGISGLGGCPARPLAVRLGRLAGRRLGVLRLRGVRCGGLAGLALVWL